MFSFLEDAVGGIISSILSQFNFLQDAVTSPLRALVNQVMAGMWVGNGANKFVSEMTDEVIPMVASILTGTQNYANGIKQAQDTMLSAFQQATSIAQSLFDPFNSIF
ncbi:MAG: hypothetical protein WCE68_09300 [Anaerolineales bacterium]